MAHEHPADASADRAEGDRRPFASQSTPMNSVVVAVLTYERNAHLPELLEALLAQAAECSISANVLLVDNNPTALAEPIVAESSDPRLFYVHEPEPGIAAGRNRALRWSWGSDAIVFIDDDERPDPGWLEALITTANATRAAGVTGPVMRRYPFPPAPLVRGMRRWDRVRRPTGSRVPAASTANLLLDLRFLRGAGLAFDPDFGLSGGSDTLLTKQLIQAGGDLVWCDEAIVLDYVVDERLTPAWLLQRARRVGNTHARVARTLDERARTRVRLLGRGFLLQAWGVVGTLVGKVVRDPERTGAAMWRRARGRGIVDGAFGRTHFDYLRPNA